MNRFVAGIAMATLLSSQGAAQQSGEERPQYRISVDTVSLAVTVLDDSQHLVNELPKENFAVYEDGVEQDIQFFFHGQVPLKMVILIDTSSSMQQKIELAREAAIQFVHSLAPGDEVQVVEFNDRVLTLVEFTADFEKVSEAIRQTEVGGATALYTAIYVSLKDLDRLSKDLLARRALVVLSDGNDTRSMLGFEDVKELALKGNVTIYSISLRATEEDLEKDKYRNAKYELDVLARETGGVAYAPAELSDLAGAYDEIATELKSQYTLGYVSTNQAVDGAWRRLQIVSKEPGTQIRARNGYFAPRPVRRRRRER